MMTQGDRSQQLVESDQVIALDLLRLGDNVDNELPAGSHQIIHFCTESIQHFSGEC